MSAWSVDGDESANATEAITAVAMSFVEEPQEFKAPEMAEIILPKWRFEYYLIGGACTICLLVVIDNYRAQKFDRLIAIMSGSLQR